MLCLFYGGGAVLAAAQILPGIEAGRDTLRGMGVPYEFAAMFSFPPENLITWVVPAFFGDMVHFPYWGRWYLWEMSLFVSVTGFLLAVYAVLFRQGRERFIPAAMAGILLLLAMGSYLPWFGLLHAYLPGFDTFRGVSKFVFQATLFVILLSAMGLDSLIREGLRKQLADPLGAGHRGSAVAWPGPCDMAIIPVACRVVDAGAARDVQYGAELPCRRGFRKPTVHPEVRASLPFWVWRFWLPHAFSSSRSCLCGCPISGRHRCSSAWLSWSSFVQGFWAGTHSGLPPLIPET